MTTDKCELLVIQDYQKIIAENNQTDFNLKKARN